MNETNTNPVFPCGEINPSRKALDRAKAQSRRNYLKENGDKIKDCESFKTGFNIGWKKCLKILKLREGKIQEGHI